MAVKINPKALTYARTLVKNGKAIHDEHGAWSMHAPTADQENDFIEKHGYAEYAKWHLGVDESKPEESKGRYSFPFGDFARVHRCAVIAVESRAAQNDHADIAARAKRLLELMDRK